MNSTVRFILNILGGVILAQFLNWIGSYIFKKYRILERKLFLKTFFLFLSGLLFIVESIIILIFAVSNGTINLLKVLLSIAGFLFGAFLLGILVRMVIQVDDISPASAVMPNDPLPVQLIQGMPQPSADHSKPWGWVLMAAGFLLTAACIYLFVAYGPQNDPPGMTAEHQQMDVVINYLCLSIALIGLVITGVGIRKLKRMVRPPTGSF